ncbi:hypothetical protein OROHE_015404 [Orobanche hederae]
MTWKNVTLIVEELKAANLAAHPVYVSMIMICAIIFCAYIWGYLWIAHKLPVASVWDMPTVGEAVTLFFLVLWIGWIVFTVFLQMGTRGG